MNENKTQMKWIDTNNKKRRFVSTKPDYLKKYLSQLVYLGECSLTQKYDDIKTDKIIKKTRKCYIDGKFTINVDIFSYPQNFVMVEVLEKNNDLKEYEIVKGFFEVTHDKLFQNNSIFNNDIKKSNIICEGTDAVGKTTVIQYLLYRGIICQDRDMDVISKNMEFNIATEKRAKLYYNIYNKLDKIVIFFINNDIDEINRRVYSRKCVNEFDKLANDYNKLYYDTFIFMKENNLLPTMWRMLNCTGLTIDEQNTMTKKIIEDI